MLLKVITAVKSLVLILAISPFYLEFCSLSPIIALFSDPFLTQTLPLA